jgi:hypothetical protein
MNRKSGPSRRGAIASLVSQAAVYSLFSAAAQASAVKTGAREAVQTFVRRVEEISAEARAGRLAGPEWGAALAEASRNLDLAYLTAAIEFDRIASATPFAAKGVATAPVQLPSADGAPRTVVTKIFAVGRGRAIIPHGHIGMASGHLVMQGAFRRRQYDRIAIEQDAWILRQTHDARDAAGDLSWISDERDNAHWLIAEEPSFTLDFILSPLRPGDDWDVQNLDLEAADKLPGGDLRARKMDVEEALEKYG